MKSRVHADADEPGPRDSSGAGCSSPMEGFLTTPEAARALRVAPDTLKRWRGQKRGPTACRIGGRVFYREADLRRWVESETGTPADS